MARSQKKEGFLRTPPNRYFFWALFRNPQPPKKPCSPRSPSLFPPPKQEKKRGCSFFAYSWSSFAYSFSLSAYSWSFFAYSGKVCLIRALRDCKQRSLTVSKKAPTIRKKNFPPKNVRNVHQVCQEDTIFMCRCEAVRLLETLRNLPRLSRTFPNFPRSAPATCQEPL